MGREKPLLRLNFWILGWNLRLSDRSLYNLVNKYMPVVNQVTITDNSNKPLTVYTHNGSIEFIKNANIWQTIR